MKRIIFHLDMDAFFAAVEVVKNPFLKGKPVIVAGPSDHRSVVSTCSYEARAFGVRSAMPTSEARRLCPQGVFIAGNYEDYNSYSNQVMEILYELTHIVEQVSIDEAYLDLTHLIATDQARPVASALRKRILQETSLTCSIGIASSKLVAKIASSLAKPNGLLEIPEGLEADFLAPLPVGKIPGIGKVTQNHFSFDGIDTIEDLQKLPLEILLHRYGLRGYQYHQTAYGIDRRSVVWEEELPKSVGAEMTFMEDLSDEAVVIQECERIFRKAYTRLIKKKMRTKGISIKLRDSNFKTITRSTTLPYHMHEEILLQEQVIKLLLDGWNRTPLRLLGVSFEKLTDGYWQPQLDFPSVPD